MDEYGGLIWSGSGFLLWLIITIMDGDKDFGENSASGQVFIMSLVLGPFIWLLVISILLETSKPEKDPHKAYKDAKRQYLKGLKNGGKV